MTSRLSSDVLAQLTPALGSLARLVARGSQLSGEELYPLLFASGLDAKPVAVEELKRWGRLLVMLRQQPSEQLRRATVEALMLRGLPEASVLLAVATVTEGTSIPQETQRRGLTASVDRLDFGTLHPGQTAAQGFEIQGGPGQILIESDQVRVMPMQFSQGATKIRVEVRPLASGLLWTTLKLVTAGETLEIPVLAQWQEASVTPTDLQIPPRVMPTPAPDTSNSVPASAPFLIEPINRLRFILLFVLMNMIGLAVGWPVSRSIIRPLREATVVSAIGGAVVGVAQWFALHKYIKATPWWIVTTCIGWLILRGMWYFPIVRSIDKVIPNIGDAIGGAVVGVTQWLILRNYAKATSSWIVVTAVGWVGGSIAFELPSWVCSGFVYCDLAFEGAFSGVLLGTAQALCLCFLRAKHPRQSSAKARALALVISLAIVTALVLFMLRNHFTTIIVAPDGSGTHRSLAEALTDAKPNATIRLRRGTHHLEDGVVLHQAVTLVGEGMEVTELVAKRGQYVLRYEGSGLLRLKDLALRWNGTAPAHVAVVQSGEINVERSWFSGAVWDDQKRVGGVGLIIVGMVRGSVVRSMFTGNRRGIHVADKAQPNLKGNVCSDNKIGITISDQAQPILENNTCQDNENIGIAYFGTAAGTAHQNVCSNNRVGILLSDQAQPILEKNTCQGNKYTGIAYFGTAAGAARQNVCSNNGDFGILLSDQAQPILEKNTCQGNKGDDIAYFDRAGGIAQGNQCTTNGQGRILMMPAAMPTLKDNQCLANKR